ncbi:hypothetical protein NPIL_367281, partial [Nephila pilipes]
QVRDQSGGGTLFDTAANLGNKLTAGIL